MSDTNTTNVEATVERYFEAWNATSGERPTAAQAVFTPDSYYCDGASEAAGLEAIVAMMDAVANQFPGSSLRRISAIDSHHEQARFAWTLEGADGATVVDGIDAMRLTPDGRIASTLGFFGVGLPTEQAGRPGPDDDDNGAAQARPLDGRRWPGPGWRGTIGPPGTEGRRRIASAEVTQT
jgi:SnoaL-like domain